MGADTGSGQEMEVPAEEIKIFADVTRVSILKALNKRRYTISELSRVLNISRQAVLYHMKILETTGYVRRISDSRKWVYYELTDASKSILRSRKVKLLIPVAAGVLSAIAIAAIKLKERSVTVPAMGGGELSLLALASVGLGIAIVVFAHFIRLVKQGKL